MREKNPSPPRIVESRMGEIVIRSALGADLPRLTEIYNHYVIHTPVTFDIEPYSVERRQPWFQQFAEAGRYRLLVAEDGAIVVGYAGTTRFRPKAAYETTVETTVYCAPESIGKGIGRRLYEALFRALQGDDISPVRRRICAAQPGQRGIARTLRI